MAYGQGMPPRNIDVVVSLFEDGRDSVVGFLAIQRPTAEQRQQMLDLYDSWLRQAQEGAMCDAISDAWRRCMKRTGSQRTRKLESQYRKVYGELPVDDADVVAA